MSASPRAPKATVIVQPPLSVQNGSTISPPVHVKVRFDAGDPRLNQLQNMFATATLRYPNDTTVVLDTNNKQWAASPEELSHRSPVSDVVNFIFHDLQIPDGLHGDVFFFKISITGEPGEPFIADIDTETFTVF
jgi:hypothetical protein